MDINHRWNCMALHSRVARIIFRSVRGQRGQSHCKRVTKQILLWTLLVALPAIAAAPPPICQLKVCFSSQQAKTDHECKNSCVFEPSEDILTEVATMLAKPTFENSYSYVYLDSKGLPTVGVGHLITSAAAASTLPFHKADGTLATQQEIKDMLAAVESHAQPAECIAGKTSKCYAATHFKQYSTLTLEQADIDALTKKHLTDFDSDLHKIYKDFDTYPAAVKKALYDMIYNLGAKGLKNKFPTFTKAIKARDWQKAADESHRKGISDTRNDYVKALLKQAATDGKAAEDKLKQCPIGSGIGQGFPWGTP